MKKSQSRELSSVPVLCSSSEGWNLVEPEVHLLREALTISFHISSFVFGRWETLFGFWVSHSKSAMQCRVPKFDVIGVRGAPLPMPECLGVPMIQSKATRVSRILGERESDCSIEEAWRSYLMDIPFDVRESVANINGNQWVALEAIWDQPEFLVAFSNRIARNFIRAIFLLADVNNCTHSERRKIYWKLAHQPKVEVLKAYEPDCCRQTVRLLEKFDFDWDNDAGSLVQFLTIIASSETRIILRHCNQITLDMAEIANDPTIPRSWKSPKTISWMAECVDAKILIEMLAAVLMRDASVKEAARP